MKGLFKCAYKLVLNAFHKRKAIAVMRIESGAVKLRKRADLLDRNFIDRLFLQ